MRAAVYAAMGFGVGLILGFAVGWFLGVYAFAVFDAL